MLLGALLGITVTDGNIVTGLATALGPFSVVIVLIFSIGIGATTAMNIYCGVLSSITVAQTFRPSWQAGRPARVLLSIIFCVLAITMALLGATNFMANYENFLTLLLCVMAPWTAVNLVDFYWVKHGVYDVSSFFAADGGIYGRYNAAALACYALGIVVQGPFLATDFYIGPAARSLGGIDVSWVVALIASGGAYLLWARRSPDAAAQVLRHHIKAY